MFQSTTKRKVSELIESLFKSAAQYPNFCEILVVDDGSSDYTYEIAWATIQKCRENGLTLKAGSSKTVLL
ncbi:MAG: glycosyltransferase [Candidatus Bathyarchaeia archaeon]